MGRDVSLLDGCLVLPGDDVVVCEGASALERVQGDGLATRIDRWREKCQAHVFHRTFGRSLRSGGPVSAGAIGKGSGLGGALDVETLAALEWYSLCELTECVIVLVELTLETKCCGIDRIELEVMVETGIDLRTDIEIGRASCRERVS